MRLLRWKFRRNDETVVCEMGLTGTDSAYHLRLDPPGHTIVPDTEVFDDAMSMFERHAMIERVLIEDGWTLDGFESLPAER
jgi:hypothetical protein